jgi:hypothetical protein
VNSLYLKKAWVEGPGGRGCISPAPPARTLEGSFYSILVTEIVIVGSLLLVTPKVDHEIVIELSKHPTSNHHVGDAHCTESCESDADQHYAETADDGIVTIAGGQERRKIEHGQRRNERHRGRSKDERPDNHSVEQRRAHDDDDVDAGGVPDALSHTEHHEQQHSEATESGVEVMAGLHGDAEILAHEDLLFMRTPWLGSIPSRQPNLQVNYKFSYRLGHY